MKTITINIPEYDNSLRLDWEDNFQISADTAHNAVTIRANREGLLSLARHMLLLAQNEVPSGSHIHLDEFNSLEDGSAELIICKTDTI